MSRNFIRNPNDIHFDEDMENYGSLGDFKDNYDTKEEKKLVFINTKDINFSSNDTMFNFGINFSPGTNKTSSVNVNFKNIVNIRFVDLIIKDSYLNLSQLNGLFSQGVIKSKSVTITNDDSYNPRFERLSDLPYLILELTDINQINYGSNNQINKASFVLKYDDDKDIRNNSGEYSFNASNRYTEYGNVNNSFYAGTNNKMLYYKNFGELDMSYYPTPRGFMKNMKVTLKSPYGDILKRMNDFLTCASIQKVGNVIKITMSKYFSPEEYSLGDRLIFTNFRLTGTLGRSSDLETFINRSIGHRIVAHSDNIADTKLYKSIDIAFDYIMKLDASISAAENTFSVDDYGLTGSLDCGGTLINGSQQMFLSLEITTQQRDNSLLHGNLT
jgi:hypothetical protein